MSERICCSSLGLPIPGTQDGRREPSPHECRDTKLSTLLQLENGNLQRDGTAGKGGYYKANLSSIPGTRAVEEERTKFQALSSVIVPQTDTLTQRYTHMMINIYVHITQTGKRRQEHL